VQQGAQGQVLPADPTPLTQCRRRHAVPPDRVGSAPDVSGRTLQSSSGVFGWHNAKEDDDTQAAARLCLTQTCGAVLRTKREKKQHHPRTKPRSLLTKTLKIENLLSAQ